MKKYRVTIKNNTCDVYIYQDHKNTICSNDGYYDPKWTAFVEDFKDYISDWSYDDTWDRPTVDDLGLFDSYDSGLSFEVVSVKTSKNEWILFFPTGERSFDQALRLTNKASFGYRKVR